MDIKKLLLKIAIFVPIVLLVIHLFTPEKEIIEEYPVKQPTFESITQLIAIIEKLDSTVRERAYFKDKKIDDDKFFRDCWDDGGRIIIQEYNNLCSFKHLN